MLGDTIAMITVPEPHPWDINPAPIPSVITAFAQTLIPTPDNEARRFVFRQLTEDGRWALA
jgi:hypothetical protein